MSSVGWLIVSGVSVDVVSGVGGVVVGVEVGGGHGGHRPPDK